MLFIENVYYKYFVVCILPNNLLFKLCTGCLGWGISFFYGRWGILSNNLIFMSVCVLFLIYLFLTKAIFYPTNKAENSFPCKFLKRYA